MNLPVPLVGRVAEKQLMLDAIASPVSEMVAILGRRRIGKTFLIKQVLPHPDFECTGAMNAPMNEQLENFYNKLREFGSKKETVPTTWLQAFHQLSLLLKSKKAKRKKIVFIDELPWMDTQKGRFLEALGHFWNDYAAWNNVMLVICGSAATWMIQKVVHNKGGLHNRITRLIELQAFTLHETELFLSASHIAIDRHQIMQLYMAFGGVPYYLKEIKKGQSVAQNIDRICFEQSGLLTDEFDKLFASLYDRPENYVTIIRAVAAKWKGLSREEIIETTGLTDGGNITKILEDLELSSFISVTQPFGKKKKDRLFRVGDAYTLFYLHFIEPQKKAGKGMFLNMVKSAKWAGWCGYAFENVCIRHLQKIKEALGITAVYTETSGYLLKGNADTQGMQIDLLIDRADRVINICEMKFYDAPYIITKEYAAKLRTKVARFREATGTRKSVFLTMITSFGLEPNMYANEMVQNQVVMDDLFKA